MMKSMDDERMMREIFSHAVISRSGQNGIAWGAVVSMKKKHGMCLPYLNRQMTCMKNM